MNLTCDHGSGSAALKPYPAYMPSGVEWLGEVPAHWEVRRLRSVVTMRVSNVDKHVREGETPVRLCNYVDVYKRDRVSQRMDFMRATATPEEIDQFRLEEGDVLITKDSEAWDDIGVPAVVTEPADDLISGYHLALLRPCADVLIGGYLLRALQSKELACQFHIAAKGVTRYGLSHAGIKSIRLTVPPLPEQAAIACYLNYTDRRIRRCIQAKEKLVELLEEQRQALINEGVTGRVDVRTGQPYSAYKPSGVEWLGEVPAHWEVRRLKTLSLVRRGASPRPIADPKYFDDSGDYAWVRIADVSASSHYLERTTQRLSVLGKSLSVSLEPGALFLSIAGSVGKPIITRIKCCIHDGFVYFPYLTGSVEFLFRVFSCGAPFARLGKLGTQLNLNTDTVGDICVGWPPAPEQAAIARYLDDADEDIRCGIQATTRQIELLREYRTRLISDVVTGKLDVRDAAAALSETDTLSTESAGDSSTETAATPPSGLDPMPKATQAPA